MEKIQEISDNQLLSVLSHNLLDLHILPTEKCNFRCTYCYEDFQIGKMKTPVINGIKNLITKRIVDLKQVRISWFGGEPLAATDVVLDISHFVKDLASSYNCRSEFSITTNGYLLDSKRFKSLIAAGVSSFQISLDGPEEIHNQTRKRADGSGTFKEIWHNLIEIAKTDSQFDVLLRVHVTPENHASIPQLLEMIKTQFRYDSRFKVFLKAIANLGGPNRGSFDVLTGSSKQEILKNLGLILGNEIGNYELNKSAAYICYASAQNSWVIRADGTLAKCTVAFDDDRNKIGFIRENGTLFLEQDKIQLWLRGLKTRDSAVMGCPANNLPKLDSLKGIPIHLE
jgi:uncharacterized protein